MSRGLFIGVIVVTLLAVGAYWSEKSKKAEEGKPPADAAPKLVQLEPSQIERVSIERKGAEPTVIEKAGGNWKITKPAELRADQDTAGGVASAIANLRWERLIEEKPQGLGSFGLAEPSVQVTYRGKGKDGKLLIGDETPTGGNYFAKLEGDPRVFTISSGSKSTIDRTPQDVRDKRLVPFSGEKTVEVSSKWQTIELVKSGNDWSIVKPKPMRADGFQVEELLRRVREARMDEAKVSFGMMRPVATVKLTDGSGTHQIDIRQNWADKAYYAKSSAVEGIHKVGEDLGKSFDNGVEVFKNKKLFDFGYNDPTKVEVRGPGESWSFVKSGEKWWLNGKEMDPAGTQILIDKLRDLTAAQFSTRPAGSPAVMVSVTTEGGKKTEKVNAASSGNVYLAQREGESVVYELTAAAIQEVLNAAKDVKPAAAANTGKK